MAASVHFSSICRFSYSKLLTKTGKCVSFYILAVLIIFLYVTKFIPEFVLNKTFYILRIKESNNNTLMVNADDRPYYQNISDCSCSRKFMYFSPDIVPHRDSISRRLNSSCSDEGTHYQNGQNVVSFSLYIPRNGNKDELSKLQKNYFEGTRQNLHMMRQNYPGYSLRLYTNLPLETSYCSLICHNEDLFWCNVEYTPSHGNLSEMVFRTWRFLPLGDPTVNVFLSRDLDSLISHREAVVVHDWLSKEDKSISLTRDRKVGHNVPILAGMFQVNNTKLGIKNGSILREEIISISKQKPEHKYKNSDQNILAKVIFYPKAVDIVAYDNYNCVKWSKFTEVRPIPVQSEDPPRDFVANRVDFVGGTGKHYYNIEDCPLECRPVYGKDWLYC